MIIFKRSNSLQNYLASSQLKGLSIGFVPTMGALHPGHQSLILLSKSLTNITICSIFINPTQFNDPKDFEKYPVTIKEDIVQLENAGCDVLFLPSIAEIYPNGIIPNTSYLLDNLDNIFEGLHRPGHFNGVCQVVERLLLLVKPDKLFLGQKDYQQTLVIKKLVQLKKINVQIIVAPTQREASGLAMSSRNLRLSEIEQAKAALIFKVLQYFKNNFSSNSFTKLTAQATSHLLQNGFDSIDYISIVKADELKEVSRWDGTSHLMVLIAATIGSVRLIDNMMMTES